MIEKKLKMLSESGIDLSGLKLLEFEFVVASKICLDKLFKQLNVQDGSATLIKGKSQSGGYTLKLRMEIYCNPKHISEWVCFFVNIGSEFNAILENWRIVVKT
ncbi:ribonuclease E inhibitor RraB [Aliiglaciecola sp. 3_MG-2023]|uniref:ribonuclease E inhibitor RraB n=1 Tax=unclassified Aliiglaciecola TaxID=2593648 RepID=UPI0026E34175|nr:MULTISPECIES: ribonuclease E inhibitor RraB [unclassified Aliiglaciecola]MDO6693830.1 ribonuclease E inhibitor RraB [Aliiglaciecola sp. 3_MG-2023]MDO6713423.1 ribonuclease E inhibitor RraB [Aliiglaciecola sp. 2_MG-2023]MDO6754557.1 ribonuclease E inhibitor RraB [Aliiglaciecola sp. 1_MG-2023]